jgi:phosphomevalonate kinase
MIVVGLSGKKYSGKDTFCAAMQKVCDLPVVRVALADPLKDEVYEHILKPHNIDRQALDDNRKQYFRLILQGWGTDFKRNFYGNDYWVRCLEQKLTSPEFKDFKGIVVVTDVRFLDEVNFIKDTGGAVYRITRPEPTLIKRILAKFKKKDNHPSECALDNYKYFDAHIINDGSIEDLESKAEIILEKLRIHYKF